MRKILHTPHWVLFTLALCTYLTFPGYTDEVIKVIASAILIWWTFAIGYYGEQKRRLMGFETKNLGLFQFNSVFTLIFATGAIFAEPLMPADGSTPAGMEILFIFVGLGFLYFVFAAIQILVFSARTIAEVEHEGPVRFSGYFSKLLMMLFFAIGVWMLQPVVKRYLIEEYDDVNPFESI